MMSSRKQLLLILIICVLIIPIIGSCSKELPYKSLEAVEGVLDLTQWRIEEKAINLDGQWEFYWNQLIDPDKFKNNERRNEYINLPNSWNGYKMNENKSSGEGYATYRLIFITDKSRLGIKIPRIFTSYNLWVNEELIGSAGKVGESKGDMIPQYLPQIALFEAQQGKNEIVIQVSNFYHRSGGILESLTLGSEKQILDQRYKNIAHESFLFGSLIIIGAYHLALFFFRKKYYASLYFGLFCIFVGIRTLLVGERLFIYLFPSFNWEIAHKVQTLTFYFGVLLILLFFNSIFSNSISLKVVRIVQVVALTFGGIVFLTPVRVFSVVNPAYQVFTVMIIIYLIVIFGIKVYQKEADVDLIVIGALALFITSLHDIIFLSIWMNDNGSEFLRSIIRSGNLSSGGQLFFVFTQSLLLARKFSNALDNEEVMTSKLKEMNLNLDELVRKRTEALEKSGEEIEYQKSQLEKKNKELHFLSLKDSLTNLWNRRHFDRTMELEWRRCLRYKRPISLMIIDIDHFKEYNDSYGHNQGDECLVQISQVIKSSCMRSSDLVARYGGDEFVVILSELGKDDTINKAAILRDAIEDLNIPHEYSSTSLYVTISIGLASKIPDANCSPKDLFAAADKALYKAKAAGKNRVHF